MAPSGRDWADKPGLAAIASANNNERELLRRFWIDADTVQTGFMSLDTEYTIDGLCELGIATRKKHTVTVARHFIVDGNRRLRQKAPKAFGFGVSEEVSSEQDLLQYLVNTLARLQEENEVVILAGHDVQIDLINLKKFCNWDLPSSVFILDTQRIWRSFINIPQRGALKDALSFFNIKTTKGPLHNGGNDAWYTMELLVRKAIQAVQSPERMSPADLEVQDEPQKPKSRTSRRGHKHPVLSGMSPSDLEVYLPKKRNFLTNRKGHEHQALSGESKLSRGRWGKRKRDSDRVEPSRLAPSPESLSEQDHSPARKRRRIFDDYPNVANGPAGEVIAREGGVEHPETIDLTGDSPPRGQGANQGRLSFIDLTRDTPSPEPEPLPESPAPSYLCGPNSQSPSFGAPSQYGGPSGVPSGPAAPSSQLAGLASPSTSASTATFGAPTASVAFDTIGAPAAFGGPSTFGPPNAFGPPTTFTHPAAFAPPTIFGGPGTLPFDAGASDSQPVVFGATNNQQWIGSRAPSAPGGPSPLQSLYGSPYGWQWDFSALDSVLTQDSVGHNLGCSGSKLPQPSPHQVEEHRPNRNSEEPPAHHGLPTTQSAGQGLGDLGLLDDRDGLNTVQHWPELKLTEDERAKAFIPSLSTRPLFNDPRRRFERLYPREEAELDAADVDNFAPTSRASPPHPGHLISGQADGSATDGLLEIARVVSQTIRQGNDPRRGRVSAPSDADLEAVAEEGTSGPRG